jgi:hypothetical protein
MRATYPAHLILLDLICLMIFGADPSGRTVLGVGLRPLGCYDRGFESLSDMDVCLLCLYVVLSCIGRGLCDGLITRPEESYSVSDCMCDHRNPESGPMSQLGT